MKIGKVAFLEELGKGAGSRVFRVRREEDGFEYALKVINCENHRDQRYLDQAKNEFRLRPLLDHPNLIKIHALEIDTGWFTGPKNARLLTEYAPGRTMDRLPRLPALQLLQVFEQIASAVAHMHSHGVIHADLKPNNLILDFGMKVKVIDFGIAQLRNEQKNQVHGTREFMAPETAFQKLINERTDIYSLGATMYRLATLQSPPSIAAAIKGAREFDQRYLPPRTLNPQIPTELSDLIGKCLHYHPEQRPESMQAIFDALTKMMPGNECTPRVSE